MPVETFHLVIKCWVNVVKRSIQSPNQEVKLADVHGLPASYHRLQVCSGLRLSLLVLAELRVLFFDDPVVLALKERKSNSGSRHCIVWVDNISG